MLILQIQIQMVIQFGFTLPNKIQHKKEIKHPHWMLFFSYVYITNKN